MNQSRLINRTLTDFFREMLQAAMRVHDVTPSEHTEYYLVNLLERFAHPPAGWDARPLALDYLESFRSSPQERYAKLKHVGETALFLSGIFMEHVERGMVSTDYYMALGRRAYGHLGALTPPRVGLPVTMFGEIAERFADFVRVLAEISFAELFRSDAQTVRIYTRWLRTRGRQDAEWLLRHGIIPSDPGSRSHH